MLDTIRAAAIVYAFVAFVSAILALSVDMETIGAMLALSLFTIPGIIGFVAYENCRSKRWPKNIAFILPALPVFIYCGVVLFRDTTDTQVYDLAKWTAALFAIQLLSAFSMLHVWNSKTAVKD